MHTGNLMPILFSHRTSLVGAWCYDLTSHSLAISPGHLVGVVARQHYKRRKVFFHHWGGATVSSDSQCTLMDWPRGLMSGCPYPWVSVEDLPLTTQRSRLRFGGDTDSAVFRPLKISFSGELFFCKKFSKFFWLVKVYTQVYQPSTNNSLPGPSNRSQNQGSFGLSEPGLSNRSQNQEETHRLFPWSL